MNKRKGKKIKLMHLLHPLGAGPGDDVCANRSRARPLLDVRDGVLRKPREGSEGGAGVRKEER